MKELADSIKRLRGIDEAFRGLPSVALIARDAVRASHHALAIQTINQLVELVAEMRGVDGTAKWLMARYKADALLSGLKEQTMTNDLNNIPANELNQPIGQAVKLWQTIIFAVLVHVPDNLVPILHAANQSALVILRSLKRIKPIRKCYIASILEWVYFAIVAKLIMHIGRFFWCIRFNKALYLADAPHATLDRHSTYAKLALHRPHRIAKLHILL